MLAIGCVVTPRWQIDELPSGDSPGCILASPGDELVVREIGSDIGKRFEYYVSHVGRVDGATFGVNACEVRIVR